MEENAIFFFFRPQYSLYFIHDSIHKFMIDDSYDNRTIYIIELFTLLNRIYLVLFKNSYS